MIAFDTNLVVRHLTHDDPAQTKQVAALCAKARKAGETVFLSQIVLCECVWVLQSIYRMKKPQVLLALESLLGDPLFEIEVSGAVQSALNRYRKGKADFSDYLIGEISRNEGSRIFYTFDKSLKNEKGVQVI